MIVGNRINLHNHNYKYYIERKNGNMGYNITLIPGDGIGPEIVREARKVLDRVGQVYGCLLYTSRCV